MFTVALIAILTTMLLALIRALAGPTVFDRILSANMFSTKTVLLISVLAFMAQRPSFLDLALLYALINFIGVVAVLKFVRYGRYDSAEIDTDQSGAPS